jgi:hypothetical protein
MVEAEGHLKLLSPSILDTYKVFEQSNMLSIGTQQQPSYTVILILLRSDFGVLGHLWSQNDVITSWLRLRATSNCKVFQHSNKLSIGIQQQPSYTVYTHPTWLRFWGSGSLVEST